MGAIMRELISLAHAYLVALLVQRQPLSWEWGIIEIKPHRIHWGRFVWTRGGARLLVDGLCPDSTFERWTYEASRVRGICHKTEAEVRANFPHYDRPSVAKTRTAPADFEPLDTEVDDLHGPPSGCRCGESSCVECIAPCPPLPPPPSIGNLEALLRGSIDIEKARKTSPSQAWDAAQSEVP
jgi:hypothetical protein